jgi:Tfp pilus assembly protein PilF
MTAPDVLLRQAHELLRQRRLDEAEHVCRQLLERTPRAAEAVHLLGLIRKEAGDVSSGQLLLRESIALLPNRGEFHANLANLLRRVGRLAEAAESYRAALALDRTHRPARLALAWTLRDLGQQAAAEAECRQLLALDQRDAQAWAALATVLRQQQRFAEAESAYRRALDLQPSYGVARHNLGSMLCEMERAEEALAELDRAQALGLRSRELFVNRGHSLLKLNQLLAAEQAYVQASELEPWDVEAQLSLAKLRFMMGETDFARSFAAATRAHPEAVGLRLGFAHLLRCCGDLGAAEAELRGMSSRTEGAAEIHCALSGVLHEQGRLALAEEEALASLAVRPDAPVAIEALVRARLSRGSIEAALQAIRTQRQRQPLEQRWIAYESLAARLSGDGTWYAQLCAYQDLVRSYEVPAPPGWSSIEELNQALLQVLAVRHRFARHPLDQSLRNGSQTPHSLLVDADPAIRALLQAFTGPVQDYVSSVQVDAAHPFRARLGSQPRIDKCWSVQLHRTGFHVNHIHPEGWISSAYYVSVPQETCDAVAQSGWLKFGEPPFAIAGCTPELFVQPRAGRLVLFPSYFWHGTNPILGDEARTTIAFDVVPANN